MGKREERQRARARERERERERRRRRRIFVATQENAAGDRLPFVFLVFFFLVRNSIKYEYDERFNEWGSEGREVGEGVWRANEDDKSRQLLLQHVAQHATHYSSSRPQSEESGEY